MIRYKSVFLAFAFFTASCTILTVSVRYYAVPSAYQAIGKKELIAAIDSLLLRGSSARIADEVLARGRILLHQKSYLTGDVSEPQDLPQLIQIVYDQAYKISRTGIVFTGTQPQPEMVQGDRISYPVVLGIKTDFRTLHQFVAALERLPFILRVEGIAAKKAAGDGNLEASIAITGFVPASSRSSP
jgi:hypothetical protein